MAEINIQRKKNSLSPWLLILLVVAALAVGAYFLLRADSAPDTSTPPATGAVAPPTESEAQARATPPPADGGSQAVNDMAAEDAPMSADELARFAATEEASPDYGRRGLQLLSATLVDLADRDDLRESTIIEKRNDLTSATSRLSNDPNASIQPGIMAAAALMQAMQQKAYPALARPVADLVQRASVLPNRAAAEVPQLREFFVRAADVVGALSKPAS